MDWRDLPPLAGLRAFAAFADTGGVAQAGVALDVSHAAISQQLRSLEAHLGVSLLDRAGRTMHLTAEGDALAHAALQGFAQMIEASRTITGANDTRPLHITATPTFAASWLMPCLPRFRAIAPDVNILLNPTPDTVTLEPGGVDIAIRYGTGPWAGLDNELWLESPMVVVGAPELIAGKQIDSADDLRHLPWLEEFGRSEGSDWLREHGVSEATTAGFIQVPGNLMLDGARDGQGIAVTVRAFVEADLQSGRLVLLAEEEREGAGYHIVTRPGVQRPPLKAFVRWLKRILAEEGA
ncbi:MAG: LysR family transcriptional regulator [Ascidiaceihabitans sp.]|nr:LysR family transcriptional regulator [Ascidiaceihabitans sp.]